MSMKRYQRGYIKTTGCDIVFGLVIVGLLGYVAFSGLAWAVSRLLSHLACAP